MLIAAAPFPDLGAKALLIEQHAALPARIIQNLGGKGRKREVLVSISGRDGASGNRRVPIADLVCADPLSDAEQAEYEALEKKLAGNARPLRKDERRFEILRLRSLHAHELAAAERRAARERFGFRH